MTTFSHSTETELGANTVALAVTFDFVAGAKPSFDHVNGGDPGWAPEVDVRTLEWSLKPKSGGTTVFVWNKIEKGPLFDLIAGDLYEELCDRVTSCEERD
jgi:hypothetical protein